ncbi:MAG: ketoacyl-ACP synthase III [Candidatus Omnitrophota bacterium]|nr:ketoacyl-ACP synthase III [Candidatus Omnitrophota bacterium]
MNAGIQDIFYHLPERAVDNQALQQENPSWDMSRLEKRIGVKKRYIAQEMETALDLATQACNKLLTQHPQLYKRIDGIIFCTQSGDYIMPPNACILHNRLNLPDHVFAFDFNLACSGYIYGLFLARGLIRSGSAENILLINADTYSKYIHPQDRSARMLFGDGAAVSWITVSKASMGNIRDILCYTSGAQHDKFIIPAGGCRLPKNKVTAAPITDKSGNVRTLENIHMDGLEIVSFVNSKVPAQIQEILARNDLGVAQIDLFIFHQASRLVLDYLKEALNIPKEKMHENLEEIGNTVSASIPIALKEAFRQGKIRKGEKVLISGFGVGLSWATAILEF